MSLGAAALRVMAAKGLSIDDIIDIAEAIEAQSMSIVDPVAEKRRAYDRERKRAAKAENSTGIPPESPPPDKESSPHPSKKLTPTRNTNPAHARGTRLDELWKPEPLTGEAGAKADGLPPAWLSAQLETFRNHWIAKTGKDATKLDWQRTWANWVLNARSPPLKPFQTRGPEPPMPMSERVAELRERYASG